MKTSIFIALLLAALMVPAFAQQSTTADQNQQAVPQSQTSAAQDQTQGQTQPAQTTSGETQDRLSARQPLSQERHEGFWGKLNPFARKKYVQRQMEPIRNRVNELDELTAANSKMIKDVDSRAQEGIRLAHAKATEADQHAVEAGSRAQMANQTAQQATTRLQTVEQVVGNLDQYQPVTQTEIRFRPGQTVLSSKAKEALDDLASSLKNQRGYVVQIQGFSSGSGHAAIQNSQSMAQAVVRYLVLNHEVPVYRIFTVGMGNAPMPAKSAEAPRARRTRGGRVEISLLKNNLDQLSAQSMQSGSGSMGTQGGTSGTATEQYAPPSQPIYQQPTQPQQPQQNAPASDVNQAPSTAAPQTTEQPAQPSPEPPQANPKM